MCVVRVYAAPSIQALFKSLLVRLMLAVSVFYIFLPTIIFRFLFVAFSIFLTDKFPFHWRSDDSSNRGQAKRRENEAYKGRATKVFCVEKEKLDSVGQSTDLAAETVPILRQDSGKSDNGGEDQKNVEGPAPSAGVKRYPLAQDIVESAPVKMS